MKLDLKSVSFALVSLLWALSLSSDTISVYAKNPKKQKKKEKKPTNVIELKGVNNFYNATTVENSRNLVFIYSPHCGYCIKLKPIFDKLSVEVSKGEHPELEGIRFYKINGVDHEEIEEKYNVQGYPHLIFIDNVLDTVTEFNGLQNRMNLLSFMRDKVNLNVTKVYSHDHLFNSSYPTGKHLVIVVRSFEDFVEKEKELLHLINLSSRKEKFHVFITNAHDFVEKYLDKGIELELVLFRILNDNEKLEPRGQKLDFLEFYKTVNTSSRKSSLESISNYFRIMARNPSLPLSKKNLQKVLENQFTTLIFLFESNNSTYTSDLQKVMNSVAEAYKKEDIHILYSSTKYKEYKVIKDVFGLSEKSAFPKLLVISRSTDYPDDMAKYIFPENNQITFESVVSFINDIKVGKVDKFRFTDTDKVYKYNDKTNVHKLTGGKYLEFVNASDKEKLLLVCINSSRCKSALTRFIRVAKKLAKVESLTFGWIDPSTNEFPLKYEHLPTIFLIQKERTLKFEAKVTLKNKKNEDVEEKASKTGLEISTEQILNFVRSNTKIQIKDEDVIELDKEEMFLNAEKKDPVYAKDKGIEEANDLIIEEGEEPYGGGLIRTFARLHDKLSQDGEEIEDDEDDNEKDDGSYEEEIEEKYLDVTKDELGYFEKYKKKDKSKEAKEKKGKKDKKDKKKKGGKKKDAKLEVEHHLETNEGILKKQEDEVIQTSTYSERTIDPTLNTETNNTEEEKIKSEL